MLCRIGVRPMRLGGELCGEISNLTPTLLQFLLPLFRPIGWPLHIEDIGIIDEPVNNSVCDGVVGKDLVELSECEIGRRYGAKLVVMSAGDHLKEKIACLGVKAHVAELVDNQNLGSSVLALLRMRFRCPLLLK